MKRILSTCSLAAWLAIPLLMSNNMAYAGDANWASSTEADAVAIQGEFGGRHDYNALMAVKLALIAIEERDQHDLDVARQFIHMADGYAAKARGAK